LKGELVTGMSKFATRALSLVSLTFLFVATAGAAPSAPSPKKQTPNILFFILDDVGIDQMKTFGYGGATAPQTPNIDAVARAGVRFRNTWAMPECSPSRSVVFTGRWPLRTNVQAVVSSTVLANSQVSPFEITAPKLLKSNGSRYESGMFGKFHLAGPDNNPFGNGGPHSLGFDYFYGWIEGEPYPVDTYAGLTRPAGKTDGGPYACGYVSGAVPDVCRFASGACEATTGLRPGLSCIAKGGLFDQGGSCGAPPSHELDFSVANAYYVSPLVINHPDGTVEQIPLSDSRARGYRSTIEVNAARDWIRQRAADAPWMATVSFSADHVPYQPAPPSFGQPGIPDPANPDCTTDAATRVLSDQTISAMDQELGRLLVELGIADRNANGDLVYDPSASNTMIVILGDNGSYAPTVKLPFDALHSKGTSYQTGVWVPLIVAGPLVAEPDREVTQMVNVADLFALFGEIGGVNIKKAVPSSHVLDAVSMLPYLTKTSQRSLRDMNFTQVGISITANNVQPAACVIQVQGAPACVQLFPSQDICKNQGGDWYGDGSPTPLGSCCTVKNAGIYDPDTFKILPNASWAIRNERFKLLQKELADCSVPGFPTTTVTEFYAVDEAPVFPRLDRPDGDLANNLLPDGKDPQTLPTLQKKNFFDLMASLETLFKSEVPCPGDGNLDKVVNNDDIANWVQFRTLSGGKSSWYDFAIDRVYDGLTDDKDLTIIQQNLGTNCLKKK